MPPETQLWKSVIDVFMYGGALAVMGYGLRKILNGELIPIKYHAMIIGEMQKRIDDKTEQLQRVLDAQERTAGTAQEAVGLARTVARRSS